MKNKEYVILEFKDKKKYDGKMYSIYTKDKSGLQYEYKLNRGEDENFIIDKKVNSIKLYTSVIPR